MRAAARAAARAERSRQQAHARHAAAQRRAIKAHEAQTKADAREAARLYAVSRAEEAVDLTNEVQERERAIETLLTHALNRDPKIPLRAGVRRFSPAKFDESPWTLSEPDPTAYMPPKPSVFARMMPGSEGRQARKEEALYRTLLEDRAAYEAQRKARARSRETFNAKEAARQAQIEGHNREIEAYERSVKACEHDAVVRYFQQVIEQSFRGEPDAESAAVGYSRESKHLVVDIELPEMSVVPEEASFRWVKASDRIDANQPSRREKKSAVREPYQRGVSEMYRHSFPFRSCRRGQLHDAEWDA